MFRKKLKTYDYDQDILNQFQYAKIETDKGDIWIKLYVDEVPNTVANFATLAKDGFYDNLKFHRVIKGFMAQGGCPHSGYEGDPTRVGTGGPGWAIACETEKNTHKHVKGTISMAHAGKDTGGSQFFICFVPCPHLDGAHTIFGGIEDSDADSMLVLDSIEQNDTIKNIEIYSSR